jgi:hypothetical protein
MNFIYGIVAGVVLMILLVSTDTVTEKTIKQAGSLFVGKQMPEPLR